MPNQVLIIEPQNELKFKVDYSGNFDMGHTTYMTLTNPTDSTVLFKIKTTAPKKYCVRPNSGFVEPKSKVNIAITPQPVHVDSNEKNKHKFMVQSVIAPEGNKNTDQVWKEISPKQLMDYKLKCVFETPQAKNDNDAGDTAAANEVSKKRVAVADESKPVAKEAVEGLTQNEGYKRDEDAMAVQSMSAFQKSENLESDLKKATDEVIHLKETEKKLIHENWRLKEDLMRTQHSNALDMRMHEHTYGPRKLEQDQIMAWVATAIAMAIIGIIIGKFLM